MSDILLQKKVSIERCVEQIRQYDRRASGLSFEDDFLKQDAIAMNLQRACECALDMANHTIRLRKLGLPRSSRESFDLLAEAGLIDEPARQLMKAMVGFRNILVHDYQRVDLAILRGIIDDRLDELIGFADQVVQAVRED